MRLETVPSGVISVMPQAWTMCSPCRCSNASIIERGAAEPPTTIALSAREVPAAGIRVERLQDAEPDRRHAGGERDVVLDEGVEQALRVEMRPGEDLLRPDQRAGERKAPRVRVEHRHDGEDDVGVGERQRVAEQLRQRVDGDRAVRVDDALRAAGRAARVAHRGREPLVDVALLELVCARGREQLLVVDRAVGRRSVADGDHVLEADAVLERLGQRPEHLVDEQDAVAGVLGDVREVVGVEAKVQRVRDHAAGREAEVRLEVLVVVPAERPDAVAVAEPELLAQRDREPLRAVDEVRVRVGVPALVRQPGRDLPLRREAARARRTIAGTFSW